MLPFSFDGVHASVHERLCRALGAPAGAVLLSFVRRDSEIGSEPATAPGGEAGVADLHLARSRSIATTIRYRSSGGGYSQLVLERAPASLFNGGTVAVFGG